MSFKVKCEEYNEKIKKANIYELKKIFVAIAGPLTNIIMILLFTNLNIELGLKQTIIYANLLITIFNLMPIYPLDGGRILKGVLHIAFGNWKSKKYISEISIIFMILLTAISSIGIYYFENIAILFIVLYLWVLVIKEYLIYRKKLNIYNLVKSIENN